MCKQISMIFFVFQFSEAVSVFDTIKAFLYLWETLISDKPVKIPIFQQD